MNAYCTATAFIVFLLFHPAAWSAQYYVATNGNDAAAGSLAAPFASIQKAADIMLAGDTCYIHGGIYRETVTPSRSGTAGNPIRFQAYSNEAVTVTGLDVVSGWTMHSGSIYRSTMTTNVTQLFAGGQLMGEARWPNTGTNYLTPTLALVDTATMGAYNQLSTLTDSNLNVFANGFWNGAKMWYLGGLQWGSASTIITAHTGTQITFTNTCNVTAMDIERGSKYFLYGTLNALDSATEWFYGNGLLYFWAPGGVNPATLNIEARTRQYGFNLSSRNHIEISGLTLKAATIRLTGTNCLMENCTILYPTPFYDPDIWGGAYGVELNGQNNTIRTCEIADSWGDGISLIAGTVSNIVENCLIHDCNWAGSWSAPIRTLGTGHAFLHNTIYNCGRSGIRFQNATRLRIEYNHVSHMGWLCKDLGAIKTGGTDGLGTVIAYNWARDHNSSAWCTGIYLDNSSTNYIVHHNVIWNMDNGIRMNKFGKTLRIYNNTMYNDSRESMAQHAPSGEYLTDVKTYNNLCTTGPFRGTDLQNNLQDTHANIQYAGEEYGDFRILENSSALDYGRVITGYTDDYAGAAPDSGAYESGGTDWVAGIDWSPAWNTLPTAAFTNDGITFDASASTDADGLIMRYDWSFGDGSTGIGKTTSHTYSSSGTYTVILTVMDDLGGISRTTNTVSVGLTKVFSSGIDLYMESTGAKYNTDTLLAGKPVSGTNPLDARRAFLKFNLTNIDSESISIAVLRLYHIEGINDANGSAFIYPITSNWDFGSVIFDQPIGSSLGTLVGFSGPFNQYIEFDITALVQSWQTNPASNYGISIRGQENYGNDAKYFQSLEGANPPQLVITYLTLESLILIPSLSDPIADRSYPKLTWIPSSNATYSIERCTNLSYGVWTLIEPAVPATPPSNSYIDIDNTLEFPVFYRIKIN